MKQIRHMKQWISDTFICGISILSIMVLLAELLKWMMYI